MHACFRRVLEYVNHLHEHFKYPVIMQNGHYMPPKVDRVCVYVPVYSGVKLTEGSAIGYLGCWIQRGDVSRLARRIRVPHRLGVAGPVCRWQIPAAQVDPSLSFVLSLPSCVVVSWFMCEYVYVCVVNNQPSQSNQSEPL